MAATRTQLLDLIAGRACVTEPVLPAKAASSEPTSLQGVLLASMCKRAKARPRHPQPVSLPGLLMASLRKQAQAFTGLGEASKQQHRYVKSVANMNAQRQQAAQAAEARRNAPMRGMTGDTEYDNLPDVKRRRLYENMERQKQEYLKSRQDLIQRKDQATIQQEAAPTRSWGSNKWVRRAVDTALAPINATVDAVGSMALGVNNLMEGRGHFWEEQKGYWKDRAASRGDLVADQANNLQMWGNSAAHGASTVGRAVNYGARKVLGASDDTLYSLKNEWDNANDAYSAKMDALQGKFNDTALKDPNSGYAKANRFAVTTSGKLLGETAALGAIGGAAGAAGRGITAGTRALSGAVRGAQAARTAVQAAQTGAQAAQAATAGAEAASTGARAASWGARAVQGARNMAANGIDYAGDALAMPFRATSSTILHPLSTARSAGGAVVNFARHPLQQGLAAMGNPALWQMQGGVSALGSAARGNAGGAAGALGDMAAMGGLGGLYIPFMLGKGLYGGAQGDGGEAPYPYGE